MSFLFLFEVAVSLTLSVAASFITTLTPSLVPSDVASRSSFVSLPINWTSGSVIDSECLDPIKASAGRRVDSV